MIIPFKASICTWSSHYGCSIGIFEYLKKSENSRRAMERLSKPASISGESLPGTWDTVGSHGDNVNPRLINHGLYIYIEK